MQRELKRLNVDTGCRDLGIWYPECQGRGSLRVPDEFLDPTSDPTVSAQWYLTCAVTELWSLTPGKRESYHLGVLGGGLVQVSGVMPPQTP